MPIDILTGSCEVREWLEQNGSDERLRELSQTPESWRQQITPALLY